MMRPDDELPEALLCKMPVDFHKGIQCLVVMVEDDLSIDPYCIHLFVFTDRRRDAIKVLYRVHSGCCLSRRSRSRSGSNGQAAGVHSLTVTASTSPKC